MTWLDELPREILIHMASFCECPDVFKLEVTSRVFHDVVNDWQVLSGLLDREWLSIVGNGHWLSNDGHELYRRAPLTAADPINLWKRYALANWKTTASQSGFQLRVHEWAPMLIAQRRKITFTISSA